jgi:2-C-methyl-D-erythritol 4-phosphate cytidylyltransferase
MHNDNCYLIIPASGSGSRMNAEIPKQYLKLENGLTIVDQCLKTLLEIEQISGCVIALAEGDELFKDSSYYKHPKILGFALGGKERQHSVLSALNTLSEFASSNDWVLVHDAVRPCIKKTDVQNLIGEIFNHSIGGILATRAIDTIKKIKDEGEVSTIDRKKLYHAQTPQMFRFGILKEAIDKAIEIDNHITDESEAVEDLGHLIKIVTGSKSNIKITQEDDLELANYYLK